MKLVSILAVGNAAVAFASALLGFAAFTSAPAILVFNVPLAAIFARHNQVVAALAVVVAVFTAVALSPARVSDLKNPALLAWSVWVAVWSVAVILYSRPNPISKAPAP